MSEGGGTVFLVELADEFELTTVDALAICGSLGIEAADGGTELSAADADRFRSAAATAATAPSGPSEPAPVPPTDEPPGWAAPTPPQPPAPPTAASPAPPAPPAASALAGDERGSRPHDDHARWAAIESEGAPPPPDPADLPPPRLHLSALWALLLSLVLIAVSSYGWLAGLLLWVGAPVLAFKAKKEIREQPGRYRGAALANVALGITVLSFVSVIAIFVYVRNGTLERTPGQAVLDIFGDEDTLFYTALDSGDCANLPDSAFEGLGDFSEVYRVDCDDAHHIEVLAELDHFGISPLDDVGDYPGDEVLFEYMLEECPLAIAPEVNEALDDSSLDLVPLFTPESSWGSGPKLLCTAGPIYDDVKTVGRVTDERPAVSE